MTWHFILLFVLEIVAAVLFFQQDKYNVTSAIFMVDFIVLILQLLYKKEYLRQQNGQKKTIFSFLMNSKFLTSAHLEEEINMNNSKTLIDDFNSKKQLKLDAPTDT